jgi:hypothetical protein
MASASSGRTDDVLGRTNFAGKIGGPMVGGFLVVGGCVAEVSCMPAMSTSTFDVDDGCLLLAPVASAAFASGYLRDAYGSR